MSLLADFDPLTSPISTAKPAEGAAPASSPSSAAAAGSVAPASTVPSASKPLPKYDGSLDYFCSVKWRSLRSSESTTLALFFAAAKPRVAEAEDLTARLLQEKAEKEKAEQEKAERERQEEEKRQEEAKAAAAAGKEEIPEDAKKVELPGPELAAAGPAAASRPGSASPPAPLDPAIAAAQLAQDKLHEAEARARNRYADKPTLHLTHTNLTTQEQTELVGAVTLKDKNTLEISDVSKTVTKQGAQPERSDVQGTFPLSVSADGKKLTGRIAEEEANFEVIDTSDPDKALASILGL